MVALRTTDRLVGRAATRAVRVEVGSAIVAEAIGGGCGRLEAPGGTTGAILTISGKGLMTGGVGGTDTGD